MYICSYLRYIHMYVKKWESNRLLLLLPRSDVVTSAGILFIIFKKVLLISTVVLHT